MAAIDAVALTQALIRCPSVTPAEGGALDLLQEVLEPLGFACRRLPYGDGDDRVDNLYARLGTAAPHFCFAGHTDVVPPGTIDDWRHDPFAAEIEDGVVHGRGASDMKGSIAAFVAAVDRFRRDSGRVPGSISLLITGDEEGEATNGTRRMLETLDADGEKLDACLIGEPTNPQILGEMVKIGRRGSLHGRLTVTGTQGHVAYPHLADNPIPRLVRLLAAVTAAPLDRGTDEFQPSNLEITSVDVGNTADNVIPARASARFNIRFNTLHNARDLEAWLRDQFTATGEPYELDIRVSGEAFLTPPGRLSDLVAAAVESVTGRTPALSTAGGTSDARFIKDYCQVVEFGLVGATMHKVDECVPVAEIEALAQVYLDVLRRYFS